MSYFSQDGFPFVTSFAGTRKIGTGSLKEILSATRQAVPESAGEPVLIFNDQTGQTVEVDLLGGAAAAAPRSEDSDVQSESAETRGRGRPKLGVVAREVTLLPRHWEWLAVQPGGASVALRKLVEEARRRNDDKTRARKRQERAYHFMVVMAGDR